MHKRGARKAQSAVWLHFSGSGLKTGLPIAAPSFSLVSSSQRDKAPIAGIRLIDVLFVRICPPKSALVPGGGRGIPAGNLGSCLRSLIEVWIECRGRGMSRYEARCIPYVAQSLAGQIVREKTQTVNFPSLDETVLRLAYSQVSHGLLHL